MGYVFFTLTLRKKITIISSNLVLYLSRFHSNRGQIYLFQDHILGEFLHFAAHYVLYSHLSQEVTHCFQDSCPKLQLH